MIRILFFLFSLLISFAHAQEFLNPAVAFRPSAEALDGKTIAVKFEIAKGYYLYRHAFRFTTDNKAASLGEPQIPMGKEKDDENFGKVEVYYKEIIIRIPVERLSSGELPLKIQASSQGCADGGICYPPQTQELELVLPDPASTPTQSSIIDDDSSRFLNLLKNANSWAILALFFIAGLGLALTPCVLPMIPILSSIIVGQGDQISKARGFLLSLLYVLGMALTYAAAGVAAGLTGTMLSLVLQNPWVLGSFALIFVLLSLSMFGFYELQLPATLQNKLSEKAGRFKGGYGLGVFIMGILSALIVGPCVAAPLAGALLFISQTGNAILGGAALFAMAIGMGIPLLAVGIAGGSLLPKSGAWMDSVKKAFGVLLLATAIWMVSPVIPAIASMLAWATLLIISAIFLDALDPLPPQAKNWQRFWKGIGIIMLLSGAAILIGALAGSRDPLQPLSGLRTSASGEVQKLPFELVSSPDELDARLASAGQPIMLDFYADTCVSCKEMERFTFPDTAVRAKLAGFTLLKADVSAYNEDDKALLARFNLFGPPGIIFFNPAGDEIENIRVVGFQDASRFLETLNRVSETIASH